MMYRSFMVRIWQNDGGEPVDLQISAESVQSGQTQQFNNMDSLLDFLQSCAGFDNLSEKSEGESIGKADPGTVE